MRINIKGTNITLTPVIKDYLEKRLAALEKLIHTDVPDEANCEVEIGRTTAHHKTGEIYKAEINCRVRGRQFRAVAEESDLYTAIDVVKDNMVEELRTDKDRRIGAMRRSGLAVKNFLKGVADWPRRAWQRGKNWRGRK